MALIYVHGFAISALVLQQACSLFFFRMLSWLAIRLLWTLKTQLKAVIIAISTMEDQIFFFIENLSILRVIEECIMNVLRQRI